MIRLFILLLLSLSIFTQRQETSLVFIHGLNQDANFWGEMPEAVKAATLSGNVLNISYGNKQDMKSKTMDELTDDFADKLLLENSNGNLKQHIIFVAHSFGGLVARNYVKNNGLFKDRIIATITIGTPHQGAPGALVTKEEMQSALTDHMKKILAADFARKNNWFENLANAITIGTINLVFGVNVPGILDKITGSIINGQIASQVDEGPVYRDISPNSSALNALNANKTNDNVLYYTLSGDERFPLFWRVLGNSIEVDNEAKEIFSSLLDADNITNESSAKSIYYKRHRSYDNGDVWYNYFNGTQSVFKNGRNSIAGINNSYNSLVKAYRYEWRTSTIWRPCPDYFDEEGSDGPEPRVSLFSDISGRAPDCVTGSWFTSTYQVRHNYRNDGLVPTWHAQLNPVHDPDGPDAVDSRHFNSHQHNHTQIGRKKGLWAKPGNDTELVSWFWFTFLLTGVEKYQDNDTYDNTVAFIKEVYGE